MRVTLIHNPGAGKQGKDYAGKLVDLVKDGGHEVRYQSCKDDDWARALEEPAELVAVAGGDGTVSRVAKRMAGRGIPIAALPSGTANNISRSLGLVQRPFEELVRAWPDARRVRLDVGMAKGPWGERFFVEGFGVGLFARLLGGSGEQIAAKNAKPDEKVADALERLKRSLQRMKPIPLKATLDGKDLSGSYLLLEAVSIPYIGSNLFLAPESKPGDGQLDVVMVSEAERDRLVHYLETWQENRERLSVLPSQRGKHLTLEWTGFELHIDDQLWPAEEDETPKPPARIDVRLEDRTVEFLTTPDAKQAG